MNPHWMQIGGDLTIRSLFGTTRQENAKQRIYAQIWDAQIWDTDMGESIA